MNRCSYDKPISCETVSERDVSVVSVDTQYDVVTPENVAFQYQLAGPFIRSIAYAVDLIVIGLYLGVSILFGLYIFYALLVGKLEFISTRLANLFFITFLLGNLIFTFWFWNALFEACWNGRTIGKAILGLRSVTLYGLPLSYGQALLRNILRFADIFLGPFAVLIMCLNDRMARLGDLAAGSMVIVEKKYKGDASLCLKGRVVQSILIKLPDSFEPSSSLRKLLTLYVSRRTEIPPLRRYETSHVLVDKLSRETGFDHRIEPDAFLCALYLRSLGIRKS